MLKKLINLLVVGLVLYLIYVLVGLLIQGLIPQVVGVILVLVFVWKALEIFGIEI